MSFEYCNVEKYRKPKAYRTNGENAKEFVKFEGRFTRMTSKFKKAS